MEVQLAPKAAKKLRALDNVIQARFLSAFGRLESDPYNLAKELRTKKLTNGRFSLRIDDYRAIYKIEKSLIMVTVIRHRKDANR